MATRTSVVPSSCRTRFCMLAYSFYEGDTRILQYATALAKRGDVVDVIALRRKGQPKHEVLHGVNVHRIQLRTVNEHGRLAYLYRMLWFLLRSAVVLARMHLAKPYKLVHVHSVPDFLVFAAAIPKLLGARVILDIHDILPEFYASKFNVKQESLLFKLLLLVERWSVAFSDHVIVANHIWHERLISRCVSQEKCTAICNYPDPRLFFPRSKARANDKFVITYPGTLNWHQGVDIAIRALARLADQIPEAELHIYGEGPAKPSLIALAKDLGLKGKVVFHDFLPTDQIVEVMAGSDLAVVPKRASSSFGNEAASTKISEFMALNVPLVVSRTKVDSYYYQDSTVKFFESDNDADLAECILLLKRDHELRDRLVSNAVKYVEQNNWDVKKHEYLRLVDSLVAARECG